jgi:NAD+ synthase (glutamine-hydrolysing)
MRIAIAQLDLVVGAIEANARRVIETARDLAGQGVDLVLFPELTLTAYPPEDLLLRADCQQRVDAALAGIREAVGGVTLVLGYPGLRDGRRYNLAGVLRDGELLAEYRKRELPNYSVFDEKRYFAAGEGCVVFEQQGVRLALAICEDVWFDAPVADAAAAGAQVVLNLNASPFHRGKVAERERQVARLAARHGVAVVYANQVGAQDELVFDGASFVCDADGHTVVRCAQFREAAEVFTLSQAGRPLAGPRQPRLEPLEEVYQALVLGVRDYVRKNGFPGVVLGLSGGIDSALTLAIAVDALGARQVEAVLMPSRYTADISNQDAAEQARRMGVAHQTIPIEPAFQAFLGMLEDAFAGREPDVTEENIQARCRGLLLMAISNKTGRMLLTTGNKSEMSVGYATLYGDMNGGFAPLKDVPKTLVYALARWRNRETEVIPERVIVRPPSAELRPDQKDSDSLPDYDRLDEIIERFVEQDQSVERIVAETGFDIAEVERITRMVIRNEYKRRQAPPGVRISQRAFGRDRRYPIVNGCL